MTTPHQERREIKKVWLKGEIFEHRCSLEDLWWEYRKIQDEEAEEAYQKMWSNRDSELTPEGIMALNWEKVTGKQYDLISNYLEENWHNKGMGISSGYYPKTNQKALSISLDQNKPLKKQMGIKKWIPYIKPMNGIKLIGITEYTLSAHGIHDLEIKYIKNHIWYTITKTTYGQKRDIANHDCLETVMETIYNLYPYKRLKDTDYDDEY